MICHKKAYQDLKKDCETCSERDACFSSHAVGVAVAEIPKLSKGGICNGAMLSCGVDYGVEYVQPTLVPHDYRDVKIADGMTITIDVEELKKQIEQSIYRQAGPGLQFGA